MSARYYQMIIKWGPGPHNPAPVVTGSIQPYVQEDVDQINALIDSVLVSGGLSIYTDEGKVHIPQSLLQRALIIVREWEEEL